MITHCASYVDLPETVCHSLFKHRGQQFVDRLHWDLTVDERGIEMDGYDDGDTTHIVVSDGVRHLGSCRVRPVEMGTMIVDHFSDTFPEAEGFLSMQNGNLYELTRFCRDPSISVAESRQMLRNLAVELDRFRDSRNINGYVAVVFAPVTRLLKSIGVRFLRLSVSKMDGRAVHLICITHAIEANVLLPSYSDVARLTHPMGLQALAA